MKEPRKRLKSSGAPFGESKAPKPEPTMPFYTFICYKTTRCIFCGEIAVTWTGHVHLDEGCQVIAGACRLHARQLRPDPANECPGCFGPLTGSPELTPLDYEPARNDETDCLGGSEGPAMGNQLP